MNHWKRYVLLRKTMKLHTPRKIPSRSCGDIPPGTAGRYLPDRSGILAFRSMVRRYYRQHGRQMAWRQSTDPYRILVSEIMLQQTQVERVTVKYPEFVAAFPDFDALAAAPLADILRAWQGMGYNRRAIALQKCAVLVRDEFDGVLPRDPKTLVQFPGIGKATASSIAAFAFNQPVVFIETNIRRVFIHFFFQDRDTVFDNDILPLVQSALDKKDPRTWYWALMDLGSTLKKIRDNPNRRSAHYTKQSAFEGSDRKIRGLVLRLLLSSGGMEIAEIAKRVPADPDRVRRIVTSLENEGFLGRSGNRIVVGDPV